MVDPSSVNLNKIIDGDELQDIGSEKKMVMIDDALELSKKRFENRDDLLNSVRNFAFTHGYAIPIKDSKRDRYVIIGCDRGGNYRNRGKLSDETRKRKTSSRLVNCPFEVVGKQKDGSWILEIVDVLHNHIPSINMSGHPSCRRLSLKEILRVKDMMKSGIPTRQILSSLRQNNPKLLATSQSVHNMKTKIFKEFLDGRSIMQALLDEFSNGGFAYNVGYDVESRMTHLFFSHPASIALTRSYSSVFVMDCTYKTNKYKLPLLNIVGVSNFNTTFYLGFAYLKKEEEEDYVWALKMFANILGVNHELLVIVTDRELALMNAIRVVFPTTANILCVWHIEKNIVARCKSHFKEGEDWNGFLCDWTSLMNSVSETEYYEALQTFETKHRERVIVLNYIRSTWIPYKERFVKAWTERYMHLGNRVTSRVKGAHATIKKYLQSSIGNLYGVSNRICLAIENQFQEFKTQLGSEKMRIPHRFRVPLFNELITHVSIFAMDEILKQCELAKSELELSACKGHFGATMGLPCVHMMKIKKYEALQLSDIHTQWRIDTKSFVDSDTLPSCKDVQLDRLLGKIKERYHEWPISQQEVTLNQISHLVNETPPFLYEPSIDSHRGRPLNSKKKRQNVLPNVILQHSKLLKKQENVAYAKVLVTTVELVD